MTYNTNAQHQILNWLSGRLLGKCAAHGVEKDECVDCFSAFLESEKCSHGLALIHQANNVCDGCVDEAIDEYEGRLENDPLDMFDDAEYRLLLCLVRQRVERRRKEIAARMSPEDAKIYRQLIGEAELIDKGRGELTGNESKARLDWLNNRLAELEAAYANVRRMTRDEAMDHLSIRMSDQWSHFRIDVACNEDVLDQVGRDALYRAITAIDRTEREMDKVATQPEAEIDYWIEE